jgi:hypothetical protein
MLKQTDPPLRTQPQVKAIKLMASVLLCITNSHTHTHKKKKKKKKKKICA